MADRIVKVSFIGDASKLKQAANEADQSLAKVDKAADSTAKSVGGIGSAFTKLGSTSGFGRLEAASSAFGKLNAEADKTTDKVDKLASRLQVGGAAAVAFAGLAVPQLAKLGNAAGDLNETVNKSNVIFGAASKTIEQFGESAAKTSGLSKRAAIDAAATFGTLFTNIGKSETEAAQMSITLTKLAGDLASFSNTSPEEAVTALGAALRGESEPIRRFGVLLDDATLKQRALSLAIYDGTGTLTPAQRAQAAYAEILAQTSKQQGDFARTSGSLANQQRIARAEFENLKATVGQGVLPAMTSLYSTVNDVLGVFNRLPTNVQAGIGTFATFGTAGLAAAGTMATVGGTILRNKAAIVDALVQMGDDGERQFTRLGKAALAAGGVFAGLTIVATIKSIRAAGEQELQNLANALSGAGTESLEDIGDKFRQIGEEGHLFDAILKSNIATAERYIDVQKAAGRDTSGFEKKIRDAADALQQQKGDAGRAEATVGKYAGTTKNATTAQGTFAVTLNRSLTATDKYNNSLGDLKQAAEKASPPILELEDAQNKLNKQLDDSRKRLDDLNDEASDYAGFLDRILKSTNDLRQKDQDWNESLLDLQETVAKNGKVWDIWTRAGIDNNRALDDTIEKVGDYIGVLGSKWSGTVDGFKGKSKEFIDEIYNQAKALGAPKERLDEIASSLAALAGHQEIEIRIKASVYANDPAARAMLNQLGAADPGTLASILGYPGFDTGGVVAGPKGSPQLVLAHSGETILPTHKMPMAAALDKVTSGGVNRAMSTVRLPAFDSGGVVGGGPVATSTPVRQLSALNVEVGRSAAAFRQLGNTATKSLSVVQKIATTRTSSRSMVTNNSRMVLVAATQPRSLQHREAKPTEVSVVVELDGRTLAKAVADYSNSTGGIAMRVRPRS